jgi:hypothetical protein
MKVNIIPSEDILTFEDLATGDLFCSYRNKYFDNTKVVVGMFVRITDPTCRISTYINKAIQIDGPSPGYEFTIAPTAKVRVVKLDEPINAKIVEKYVKK